MKIFDIYHNVMKSNGNDPWSPPAVSSWPDEWTTIYRKWYERFKTLMLPFPEGNMKESVLLKSFFQRGTDYHFNNRVQIEDLSDILYFGAGENHFREDGNNNKRFYPSAGAKYPVEVYVVLSKDIPLIQKGVYHYDPQDHVLQELPFKESDLGLSKFTAQPNLHSATGVILFTAVLSRSTPKYGERAYKYALIESGAIMQSMCLVASSREISMVPISLLHDPHVESILLIDGTNEAYLHSLFFG